MMEHIKTASASAGKVVMVVVGVPYGLAILINSLNGWPQSNPDESRFRKQLKPARVIRLNQAFFQQMTMLKWLPLFLRVKSFYRSADSMFQNIPFGQNRMKMDIWLPRSRDKGNKKPVVFFIYGGAWGSGNKELYAKLGQEVANMLGTVVVIPDYRIYPKGTMQDMVQDITDSIHEFSKMKATLNISLMTDDGIILMGHSAGAHLCTLTVINLVANDSSCMLEKRSSSKVQEHCLPENNIKDLVDEGKEVIEVGPSSMKGVIGIGGVYNIMDHYNHEATRGVEDISSMWQAAEGMENFGKYSPSLLIPCLTEDQKTRLPPHMLIHGMKDTTVPDSSSIIYAKILSEVGVTTHLKMIHGAGHAEMVMDMMEHGRAWYNVMMGTIMEGVRVFSQEDND